MFYGDAGKCFLVSHGASPLCLFWVDGMPKGNTNLLSFCFYLFVMLLGLQLQPYDDSLCLFSHPCLHICISKELGVGFNSKQPLPLPPLSCGKCWCSLVPWRVEDTSKSRTKNSICSCQRKLQECFSSRSTNPKS